MSGPSGGVTHSSSEEFFRSIRPGDSYGDSSLKDAKSTRLVFQNVNGLPESAVSLKQQQIQKWLMDEQVGIALFAETNRHWPSLQEGSSWRERIRSVSSKGFYTTTSHNRHRLRGNRSTADYGGTAAALLNQTAHAAKEAGVDPTGLGRWSYIRIQGKTKGDRSHDLVVVSAYRPNPPGVGESTVWAQHRRYFLSQRRTTDPRLAFTLDLQKAIKDWRNQGCEVVLGLDANEDLSVLSPSSFRYKMREVGLEEQLLRHHPVPQATHQRNSNDIPIDGIFATSGVRVISCGYYAFDEHFSSDHRGLWMDFDLCSTLGGYKPPKQAYQPRILSTQDPRGVRKYLKAVLKGYKRYDIARRLDKIASTAEARGNKFDSKLERQFNCLHRQAYDIRRQAELNCRKRSMGGVPWSPKIQEFWDRISLWKLLLKSRLKCRVSSRKLRRLMAKLELPNAWTLPTTEIEGLLRATRKEYKEAKRGKAAQWRRDHIGAKLVQAKRRRGRSKAAMNHFQRLRRMRQREEARRRRRARGKGSTGGLKAIQIQSEGSDELITIRDQEVVEQGCRTENTARYDQTRFPFPTPPMTEPLYSMFNGPEAEANSMALLRGALPLPNELDPATRAFLQQCRFHHGFQFQNWEVTTASHIEFWKKMKESRGSEPHGLHNGHFKAGAQSPLIAFCDALFRHLPLVGGFVPEQWRNLMNFAIEKKPGDFRPSKMRTIQLMNSEFNANNKLVGRQAMQFAEEHNLIPAGQCGSRKQHQSIDLALSKRLVWDQLTLQRRAAGWISNDAKSCFDRVVHSIAMLALLRFGVTWATLSMMFNTLSTATHRVRTGFGDSDVAFYPPSEFPFQGCGQGNGAGPPIWVSISSVLILMMEIAGFGFESLAALSLALVTAQCFSFIDDTDAIEAAKSVLSSAEDIFPQIQAAAKLWSGGIRATGGAINPDKSFWYFLDYVWNPTKGQWSFRNIPDSPGFQLRIYGLDGALQPCTRKSPHDAERTLGVMMSPDDNPKAHYDFVFEKATSWAEALRPNQLRRYDVLPVLKTTILKSLEYPSPLSHISYVGWTMVMSKPLQVCLPKAGVCRSFPRKWVYAPLHFQGLDIPHPYAVQVFRQLEMLLRHAANRTQTGAYLSAVLQAHQLETGSSYGLFQQVYSNTAILATNTWVKRSWEHFEALGIFLTDDTPVPSHRSSGDHQLIDLFVEAEVDQEELKWLNWCRLYLQANTLSDIVTADGRSIRPSPFQGSIDAHGQEVFNWARSEKPSKKHWDNWRRVLSRLVLQPGTSLLKVPLRGWTDPLERWKWVYSPSAQLLFCRHNHIWIPFHRISSRSTSRAFTQDPTTAIARASGAQLAPRSLGTMSFWHLPLPTDICRVSVQARPNQSGVEIIGHLGETFQPPKDKPTPSVRRRWMELRSTVTEFLGWVPSGIVIEGSEEALSKALSRGDLCVISDGSYKDPLGTAVSIITTETGTDRIVVFSQTPGQVKDQSAYRSELIGILAGIMVFDWLRTEWLPDKRRQLFPVEIACDGLSALRNSFGWKTLKPTQRQFDLLSAIRGATASTKIQWNWRHVKGHKDDALPWEELNWWEQRNVEADRLAGAFRKLLLSRGVVSAPNARFFTEPRALFIGGIKQSRLELTTIRALVSSMEFQDSWQVQLQDEVDFQALGRAMRSLRPGIQRWVTKHSFGMCGVGKWMKRWKFSDCDKCPFGCNSVETAAHVPRCPSEAVHAAWAAQVDDLEIWMDSNLTAPIIQKLIIEFLQQVRGGPEVESTTVPSNYQAAINSQQRIGAQGLLEGRLSRHWQSEQAAYYRQQESSRSAPLWAARLSQRLILIGHALWLHRNETAHSEESAQNKELSKNVNERIRRQFKEGPEGLHPNTRGMLREGLRKVLAKPLAARREWISSVSLDRKRNRRALTPQRALMHRQFKRARR